jgi:hypothetical protein
LSVSWPLDQKVGSEKKYLSYFLLPTFFALGCLLAGVPFGWGAFWLWVPFGWGAFWLWGGFSLWTPGGPLALARHFGPGGPLGWGAAPPPP